MFCLSFLSLFASSNYQYFIHLEGVYSLGDYASMHNKPSGELYTSVTLGALPLSCRRSFSFSVGKFFFTFLKFTCFISSCSMITPSVELILQW